MKSEARSLAYVTLVLVLHRGHLAGSHPTILAHLLTASYLTKEVIHLIPPTIRHLLYVRLPTSLAQPVDWRPVYNYGVTTDTTLVPSSSSTETCVGLIDNTLHQIFLPSEVENLIRE